MGTYSGNSQIDASGSFDTDTPPGIYNLVYEYVDANTCSDTAHGSIEVLREPQPPTFIGVDISSYCINDKPENIILSCDGLDDSYDWYATDFFSDSIGTGKTLSIPAPDATTTYLVRSEMVCGESSELSITVTVYEEPQVDFSFNNV